MVARRWVVSVAGALALGCALSERCVAGGTTITYQGVLVEDGAPAQGVYFLRFSLWSDDAPPDPPGEQVGDYTTKTVTTSADGLFTTALNEANEWADALYSTGGLYLQIDVSTDGSNWIFLDPRQLLTSATPSGFPSGGVLVSDCTDRPPGAAIDIEWVCDSNAATFEQTSAVSTQDLLVANTAGLGSAIRAATTGSGAAFWASAANLGRAARFEITGLGNTETAVEMITAGPGSALRTFSMSGPAILAESTSGVGLRATSTSGTALDVVGTSAFSATAAFNSLVPFTVPPGAAEVANLDAARLNGNPGSFYRNAANLTGVLQSAQLGGIYGQQLTFCNALNTFCGDGAGLTALNASSLLTGTVADLRLSGNIPRLDATQTFTGANTIDNTLHVTGSVTRAYTVGTANPVGPLAYGTVTMAGGLLAHTPNVQSVVLSSDGQGTRYDIHIAGVTYTVSDFVTNVTPLLNPAAVPAVAGVTDDPGDGDLVVRIHNLSGTTIQRGFHFVVYQP
ncbi:MAG: hypothetical protein AB7Q17_06135 [Phycisphaerae bacterium]